MFRILWFLNLLCSNVRLTTDFFLTLDLWFYFFVLVVHFFQSFQFATYCLLSMQHSCFLIIWVYTLLSLNLYRFLKFRGNVLELNHLVSSFELSLWSLIIFNLVFGGWFVKNRAHCFIRLIVADIFNLLI